MKSIISGVLILTVSFFTLKTDRLEEVKQLPLPTVENDYLEEVIINKIDTIEYNKQRIRDIQSKLK